MVCVGPPLFCNVPRRGSGDFVGTQVPSVSRFPPASYRNAPKLKQFVPVRLFARMLLLRKEIDVPV